MDYLLITVLLAHETNQSVEGYLEKARLLRDVHRQQKFVSRKLAEFLQSDVRYTLRRVLAAESAKMYLGPARAQGSPHTLTVSFWN